MLLEKFIYDLSGRPEPAKEEIDDDIDRLLLVKGAEEPNYLAKLDERDQLNLDSEVAAEWIRKKFEPALIVLLFESGNNKNVVKSELAKMYSTKSFVERWFRFSFVERQSWQRVRELCFDSPQQRKITDIVNRLKKTLTFLSNHLEQSEPNYTLLGTDAYTPADVILYSYLKRIVIGNFDDLGLKRHLKLCEPLRKFMHRFAAKNVYVIDISNEDPLASDSNQNSLMTDLTKPALVALGFVILFVWRKSHKFSP